MQFVIAVMNTGYSVEAQITGSDTRGGIQFEIISPPLIPGLEVPSARPLIIGTKKNIIVKTLTG